jgi:class 3 adenylate cyclase
MLCCGLGETSALAGLTVRMGLHTGLVAVGGLGEAAGSTLALIGDVARLATLLQAQATPDMLLCSAAAARLVRELVVLERAALVPDGEQPTPVTTYQILGLRLPRRPVVGRGARVLSRFVGRVRELALLQALLAQVEGGWGRRRPPWWALI